MQTMLDYHDQLRDVYKVRFNIKPQPITNLTPKPYVDLNKKIYWRRRELNQRMINTDASTSKLYDEWL